MNTNISVNISEIYLFIRNTYHSVGKYHELGCFISALVLKEEGRIEVHLMNLRSFFLEIGCLGVLDYRPAIQWMLDVIVMKFFEDLIM